MARGNDPTAPAPARPGRRRRHLPALAALMVALAAGVGRGDGREDVRGGQPPQTATRPAAGPVTGEAVPDSEHPAPAGAGVRAIVDPATGRIVSSPSPEQRRQLALTPRAGLSRSFVGLQPFALRHGGRGVNLQGRFQSAFRVERTADGGFVVRCGDADHEGLDPDHAHRDGPGSAEPGATAGAAAGVER